MRAAPLLLHGLVVLGLGLLVLGGYSNSRLSGFVLDNQFIVQEDPRLADKSWHSLGLIWSRDYWFPKAVSGLYRPITTTSFWVQRAVLGQHTPGPYHWFNLALHWANAVLAYFVLARICGRWGVAAGGAAIFAVHPIGVESVTNIVGRADLLAAACVMGGFLLYVSTIEQRGWRKWLGQIGVMLIMALGVLCKESALVLAALIPAYDLVYRWNGKTEDIVLGWIPLIPPTIGLLWVRHLMAMKWGTSPMSFLDNPLRGAGFLSGRLTAVGVIGRYLRLLVWPDHLSCDYSYATIPLFDWHMRRWGDWATVLWIVLVASVLLGAALALRRRHKTIFMLVMWFFIALLPTSNLMLLIDSIMAERFVYLPMVGFAGGVALATYAIARSRWLAPVLILVVVVGLAVRTRIRNADWQSNYTLWGSAVKVVPNSYRAHESFSRAIYLSDPSLSHGDEAIAQAQRAMDIVKELPLIDQARLTYLYLGSYYAIKGDSVPEADAAAAQQKRGWYEQARDVLDRAAQLDQARNDRYRQRALQQGRNPRDIRDFRLAELYGNLGTVRSRLGDPQGAIEAYRIERRLDPLSPAAYWSIAQEHVRIGQLEEAAVCIIELVVNEQSDDRVSSGLVELYRAMTGGTVTPLVQEGDAWKLNTQAPLVKKHICQAYLEIAELRLGIGDEQAARNLQQRGGELGCSAEEWEKLWKRYGQ